jgi:beta-xylosidase
MNPHQLWGDLGNGYYANPILKADFSDPDLVRVGEDFFMVCSDFHYMGIPVLHSRDLVNWSLIGRVYDRLDIDPRYDAMEAYGRGSWAPSIRYQGGLFYVYFCTPDEGLYMSTAQDPAGPWAPLHEVQRIGQWEDPCPFWDDDGQAYLGHSTVGAGPIIIHRMRPDGRELLDQGRIVYVGKTAEGTKIYKRNGYYYLVIPEGGVERGWQTVLRSKDIYGPYERRVVLGKGRTAINGPHQGGLVELPSGESWFLHFQSAGALGRVCHLQPVEWVDDWPVMGRGGEPVEVFNKPRVDDPLEPKFLVTGDDFDQPKLGLQWQWNHNPVNTHWSLTERPGYLRLKAMPASDLSRAKNTLTQKLIGGQGTITAELDRAQMAAGQLAGLTFLGGAVADNYIGLRKSASGTFLEAVGAGIVAHGPRLVASVLWLRAEYDFAGASCFSFSLDGEHFLPLGGPCELRFGYWKGARIGLFTYQTSGAGGIVDVGSFRYDHDGPPYANLDSR